MTDLRNYQYEILDSEDSGRDGLVFGYRAPVAVDAGGFSVGETDWITQDAVNQTRGTTMFGRDTLAAPTWVWSGHVDQEDEETALATLAQLRSHWGAPRPGGWEPGELTTLRYRLAGRTRRIYGRPRRFTPTLNNLFISGNIPLSMDFKLADPLHYDDVLESSGPIPWNGIDSDGGFVLPAVMPITTLPGSQSVGRIRVGGDTETYPIIRFNGPITDPSLATDTWSIKLNTSISSGSYVEIDTRPWHLTALRDGYASVAGRLGRRQWLSDIRLRPGTHSLAFRGASAIGGGSCIVSWRNAWTTL